MRDATVLLLTIKAVERTEDIIKLLTNTLVEKRNKLVYECADGMEAAIRSMNRLNSVIFLRTTLECNLRECSDIHEAVLVQGYSFTDAYNKVRNLSTKEITT